ncbi:hypothetical protein I656_01538 [Geobacillus sp. WSUCF1]|nr:hypothetical protein I656_01538 [Geobacillus sp. WSUCF1]
MVVARFFVIVACVWHRSSSLCFDRPSLVCGKWK